MSLETTADFFSRFQQLKSDIVAELVRQKAEESISIIADYFYLNKDGKWFLMEGSDLTRLHTGGDELSRLADIHLEDFFSGTRDTNHNHYRAIVNGMEEALTRLQAPK